MTSAAFRQSLVAMKEMAVAMLGFQMFCRFIGNRLLNEREESIARFSSARDTERLREAKKMYKGLSAVIEKGISSIKSLRRSRNYPALEKFLSLYGRKGRIPELFNHHYKHWVSEVERRNARLSRVDAIHLMHLRGFYGRRALWKHTDVIFVIRERSLETVLFARIKVERFNSIHRRLSMVMKGDDPLVATQVGFESLFCWTTLHRAWHVSYGSVQGVLRTPEELISDLRFLHASPEDTARTISLEAPFDPKLYLIIRYGDQYLPVWPLIAEIHDLRVVRETEAGRSIHARVCGVDLPLFEPRYVAECLARRSGYSVPDRMDGGTALLLMPIGFDGESLERLGGATLVAFTGRTDVAGHPCTSPTPGLPPISRVIEEVAATRRPRGGVMTPR